MKVLIICIQILVAEFPGYTFAPTGENWCAVRTPSREVILYVEPCDAVIESWRKAGRPGV